MSEHKQPHEGLRRLFSVPLDEEVSAHTARMVDLVRNHAIKPKNHDSTETSSTEIDSTENRPVPEQNLHTQIVHGTPFGRYTLIRKLGSGTMGVVYCAYDQVLDRTVAIKILRESQQPHAVGIDHSPSSTSSTLLKEARALASINHQNIVTIHDTGQHHGQEYIAMELIQGKTLSSWFHKKRPRWPTVLRIMIQAAEGLQAAHQRNIIHRDFKPENVMISEPGPIATVMDFGLISRQAPRQTGNIIADALSPTCEGYGNSAGTSQFIGTPAYMAPEQWRHRRATQSSDQFAFCVTFWEVLFGSRPFPGDNLEELRSNVLEGNLIRPPALAVPVPSRVARKTVKVLSKGLAYSPEDRWPSMSVLVMELSKLAPPRRQVISIVASGSIAATVTALTLFSSGEPCEGAALSIGEAWNQETRTTAREAVLSAGAGFAPFVWDHVIEPSIDKYTKTWAEQYTDACEATAIHNKQSEDLLDRRMKCLQSAKEELLAVTKILMAADSNTVENAHLLIGGLPELSQCSDLNLLLAETEPPSYTQIARVEKLRQSLAMAKAARRSGHSKQAQEILDTNMDELLEVAYEPLETEFSLEHGQTLRHLDRGSDAETHLRRALRLSIKWNQTEETWMAANELIFVLAEKMRRPKEALRYREVAEGASAGDYRREARTRNNVGIALFVDGDYESALHEYEACADLSADPESGDPRLLASARQNIANVHLKRMEPGFAVNEFRTVASIREAQLGPLHPETLVSKTNLASALTQAGRYKEAEEATEDILRRAATSLSERHETVHIARTVRALIFRAQGRINESEEEHRAVLALREETFGPYHSSVASSLINLAIVLSDKGEYEEESRLLRRALFIRTRLLGDQHVSIAAIWNNLATPLRRLGRPREALEALENAENIWRAAFGPSHIYVATAQVNQANIIRKSGDPQRAIEILESSLRIHQESFGEAHREVGILWNSLAIARVEAGDPQGGEEAYLKAIEIKLGSVGPEHLSTAISQSNLAELLLDQGRTRDARPFAEAAWEQLQREGMPPGQRAETAFLMARMTWELAENKEDRGRARHFASQAAEDFGRTIDKKKRASDMQKWIDSH